MVLPIIQIQAEFIITIVNEILKPTPRSRKHVPNNVIEAAQFDSLHHNIVMVPTQRRCGICGKMIDLYAKMWYCTPCIHTTAGSISIKNDYIIFTVFLLRIFIWRITAFFRAMTLSMEFLKRHSGVDRGQIMISQNPLKWFPQNRCVTLEVTPICLQMLLSLSILQQ